DLLGWIPMLDQVPKDAIPGEIPVNFLIPGRGEDPYEHEVATVISFEGDFGHLVRDRVDMGARLITVATNTSTWKHTWASAQHLAMSQVRAAETRVPVVHAALSGISGYVSHDGVAHGTTELYEEATVVFDIATATDISIYARTGEWLPLACSAVSLIALAIMWRRRSTVAP
ncbi:MAG TPA: hypothetical protein VG408_09250, partial [Actinomycetota bacterium]|nr:hypothetical protein [Actinomycetota bacterium]